VALKFVLPKVIARCRGKIMLQDAIGSRSHKSGSKAVSEFLFDVA